MVAVGVTVAILPRVVEVLTVVAATTDTPLDREDHTESTNAATKTHKTNNRTARFPKLKRLIKYVGCFIVLLLVAGVG